MIPTVGVYPIATANDKDQISAPLMSRFAVIEIPDYTPEEKKIIFSRYALPKVLKRIGMKEKECILTPEGLDAVISYHENTSGIPLMQKWYVNCSCPADLPYFLF